MRVCHCYKENYECNTWSVGVKIAKKGQKLFMYVHFGVRYLCTIYVSIFIFLVKNVDIYENVNIRSMEPCFVAGTRRRFWSGRSLKFNVWGRSECNF